MSAPAATSLTEWIALVIAFTLTIGVERAEARMYQWSNAATGTVQLSGSPPAWYRSAAPGPRVLVFDNGQLVDDTAMSVAEEHRQVLRAKAFGEQAPRGDPAAATAPPHDALHDALEKASSEGVDVNAVTEAFAAEQALAAQSEDEGMVEQTVAELKALLDAWDSRRLSEAKALLRGATKRTE